MLREKITGTCGVGWKMKEIWTFWQLTAGRER